MKRSSLFWGCAIVLLGAVLLASNLGVIQGNVWGFFWPALIILAGIWFLMRSSAKNLPVESVASNVPLEGAVEAEIEFNHGAGRLIVDSTAQQGDLLSGRFTGGVTANVDRSGSSVKVALHTPTDLVFEGPLMNGGHGYEWKVGVTPTIPVKIHVHTGASESKLDLSNLKASDVVLETGASSSEVVLPANAGYTKVKIESGVSSVKVTIPQGVAASIKVDSGLAGIDIDTTRFVKSGKKYISADYATAVNKIDLDVETGVGSVEIH